MNRRLAVTMLAIAIAGFSASAFALAPVIGTIKSPVITDENPVSSTNNYFVYPDALNLDSLASDDTLATNQIIWSYTGSLALGDSRYRINLRTPLNIGGGDNPNSPGAKSLVAGDDLVGNGITQDANLRTITLRDFTYSPDTTIPDANADVDVNQVVTLFASDGSAFSQKNVVFYTDGALLGGNDRLSPTTGPASTSIVAQAAPASAGTLAWTSSTLLAPVTYTAATTGLCLTTTAAGDFFGSFISPYNIVSLTANSVYRFRLRIDNNTATATAPSTFPLWDLTIDNFDPANPNTGNKYFGDYINFDNFAAANLTGGSAANGVNPNSAGTPTTAIRTFDVYFTPPPALTPNWNANEFLAGADASNDMRLLFRIIDVNIPANNANLDLGSLCLRTIQIDRIPIANLPVLATYYDPATFVNGTTAAGGLTVTAVFGVQPTANGRTTVTFAGGDVTIAPTTTGFTDGTTAATAWGLEVINVDMGNATAGIGTAESLDNWPIPWNTGELLKGTMGLQAPNQQAVDNPPDVLQMIWDSPTSEVFQTSTIAATSNTIGMPQLTPADYTAFFYTHTRTNGNTVNGATLRLRLQILNTGNILSGGVNSNIGGVTMTKMRVDRVEVPQ